MPELGEHRRGREIGFSKSARHEYIWLACSECGKERWVHIKHGKPEFNICQKCKYKYNAKKISGENNYKWKDGKTLTPDGYIEVHIEPDSFFARIIKHDNRGYEHRLVMAEYLGRLLHPWEHVHHKNGVRGDNRLANLELLTASEHAMLPKRRANCHSLVY